jgi:cystathionine gamma-lyase
MHHTRIGKLNLFILTWNSGFATRAIHAGNTPDQLHGGVNPSIELSTTYVQPEPGVPSSCYDYSRCGNPTVMALQRQLAALEHANYAFATNCGMTATTSILSLLKAGDHLICIDDVYGGTQRYLRKVYAPQTNIEYDMIDMSDIKKVRAAFKANTKLVWIESPTNPTLKCTDIEAVSKICKEKGVLLVVDNTFMSPALQNPLLLGADVVMHSLTKYIGGHSDVVAGALMFNDSELYDKLYFNIKSMGSMISPFDAYLALRGAKTLQLRAEKASENALKIAEWLMKHKKIEKVIYPGLPSHPHHKIALKNRANNKLSGGSGMLGFYVKGDIKATGKFLSALHVITLAESLGGVESLIEAPSVMTHGSVPPETRKLLGIDDNFVRMSAGCENIEDLLNDLDHALSQI